MTIFGLNFSKIATPFGIVAMVVIVLWLCIKKMFDYLTEQSNLAKINRELTEQITKLSSDLGKTKESYERVVNALDQSQQQVIFLHQCLNFKNGFNAQKSQDK